MILKKNNTYIFATLVLLILTLITIFNNISNDTIIANASPKIEHDIVNIDSVGLEDFTNIRYIDNANYFLVNPRHAKNNTADNALGTCTTVAMQLLMGYHNYYSDRRLIPTQGDSGRIFLSSNYGDIFEHPVINSEFAYGQGRASIGTEDGVYHELLDLTGVSDWVVIGQSVGLVKDGAVRFVNKYATSIKDAVSITSGIFSESIARAEIDAGRPIILGFVPIPVEVEMFHVVPAYGYATYDGVFGFIVHYGWGEVNTHVWVPSSCFGFQIKMEVNHTHDFKDTGVNINNTYRKLDCDSCGGSTADSLFKVDSINPQKIVGLNYPLLGDVIIPSKIYDTEIIEIGASAFYYSSEITNVTIPATVTSIGSHAFAYCTKLQNVTFAENSQLTSIDYQAFMDCSSLESIEIPAGVTSITTGMLRDCTSLQSITFESGSQLTSIGNNAFTGCTSLTEISLPSSVTSIGSQAFSGCVGLCEITLPFVGDTINNPNYTHLGYIFNTSTYSNQNQYLPESLTKVTILGGDIYSNAFYGCNKLTQISISTNVESIGIYAFNNCTSLQSVNFANSSQLSTIGDQAFNGCGNLSSISIPATVTSIGGLAFNDCVSLQSVTFASGSQLTSIGQNAFSDCSSLTSISIPATVTNIGSYVFNDCTSLQSVNFAENSQLTFISYNAFSDCSGLTSITIPASITSIGMQAFNTCTSLQSINFAENSQLSSIDYQAFINCSSLNSIQIPAGVTIIHPGVLSGCTSLQSVTFASGTQLSSIANNAFTGCTSLTNIALPATVTNIGYEAFYGCTNLEKVVIYNQSTVPTLGTDCFTSTASTLQICVPNSLLNSYKTATNWSGYASKLEGYYIENGQPYILQTYTVSAADLLDCISLYSVDSNYDIESEGGVFLEYTAVIGYGMGHYFFAECLLDYDLGEVVDCSLKIEVYAGGTGCYLLDSDKYVITWCSVEDYILTVPFMEIYNYCEGEFYLFPEEDCEENIEFTAQDVSIEYVAKVNI